MICYKDMTFCTQYNRKLCVNHNCFRALTETEKGLARVWWGGEDFPYNVGDMKSNVCGFLPGEKRMTKTALEIIREYLIAHNYEGLYNDRFECGCELSDLNPCESDISMCKPGYKHQDPSKEYDFLILEELK